MQIAILGAGFVGLTAAYRLLKKGHRVTIFEKGKSVGGLAAGFREKDWDWHLEYFFHHLFTSDTAIYNLISELGLKENLFYLKPKTSIFYNGKIYQFDSPLSVLRFSPLNLGERLRVGLVTFFLKISSNWQKLEKIEAVPWLKKYYGERAYQILWQPLLKSKFGNQAEKIAMSWFWARIKKRSRKLGYLKGGFQVLIEKLAQEIKENGGKFYLNSPITTLDALKRLDKFDRIIITTPTAIFFKEKKLPEMIGAVNLILVLKHRFLNDNTYWLNINDPGFPFVALVEHTNFVEKKHYGGHHLLYVGGYYPQNHRYFKMSKEQIFKEFLPYLQKINPNYQFSTINYHLFRNPFAQPVIPVNYSKSIPPHQTPIPHVFLANMQQVYPWDRGTNYAVELGEKIADEVQNSQ